MQTLTEIRQLLTAAGRRPNRRLGQSFLIDGNLMGKLLSLADVPPGATVLEVGAGTGSLTEELLARSARVVAVEIDATMTGILRRRLADRDDLTIVAGDALAAKGTLAPAVAEALGGERDVHLVANLPYGLAVPLVTTCLLNSWRQSSPVGFERLTFTVQQELADRLTAPPSGANYGRAGIVAALLTRATSGRPLPPEAFWPRPKVHSRMLRLDFDPARAGELADANTLEAVLTVAFAQRRKKIHSAARRKGSPFPPERFLAALAEAGIDPSARPQQVPPEGFRTLANVLAGAR